MTHLSAGNNTDGKVRQSFKAIRKEYPSFCGFVMGFARQYTEDKKILNDIELCLGELFSNLDFYSAKEKGKPTDVTVTLSLDGAALCIVLTDNGIPFDPLARPKPSLAENRSKGIAGGFGIYMVRQMMDEMSYQYDGNNNLTLKKKLGEATA